MNQFPKPAMTLSGYFDEVRERYACVTKRLRQGATYATSAPCRGLASHVLSKELSEIGEDDAFVYSTLA